MRPAGRALIGLWAAVLLVAGGGAALLQLLGPPSPERLAGSAPSAVATPSPGPRPVPSPGAGSAASPTAAADAGTGAGAIPPPDPALLEPAPDLPGRMMPRVGADGRTPARVYAAHAGLPAHGPQVAILLEGLGLYAAYSQDAIDRLPAAISFGVSPYADEFERPQPSALLDAARQAGHETWLSLPMEPANSQDDEGPQALSTGIEFAHDRQMLEWALSRFQGYVGATNALSGLRGDRFASSSAFGMVAKELALRGLLYVDAGTTPHVDNGVPPDERVRHADLTLDEQPDATDIEARLSRLEQIATSQGSALGIAGPLRPVTIDRLRAWSEHLAARGITLVPVSALPPPTPPPVTPASLSAAPAPTADAAAVPDAPVPGVQPPATPLSAAPASAPPLPGSTAPPTSPAPASPP